VPKSIKLMTANILGYTNRRTVVSLSFNYIFCSSLGFDGCQLQVYHNRRWWIRQIQWWFSEWSV